MTSARARLCVIVCGAGPAPHVSHLVSLATEQGWSVQIVATPSGLTFIDTVALEQQTGHPVRSDYGRRNSDGQRPSAADALLIAPATYNTINKLAAGINDTYALNVAAEAIGRGTPTTILPFVNTALASRAPFLRSVQALQGEQVTVLTDTDGLQPHPPGTGDATISTFPWDSALATLSQGNRRTAH